MPSIVPLADWAAVFMLVIARFSPIIFLMPGIGEQIVPIRIRLQFLLALAFLFTAGGIAPAASFAPFGSYFTTMIEELIFGVILGVSLRVVIWALSVSGSIIAQSIGLSQFLGVAMEHEAQTITSNILIMAGAVILLSVNYHVAVVGSLVEMYGDMPPGHALDFDFSGLSANIFHAFNFAILLAWPFVAVNLIYNICLGFINKALPQLMVAFVGAPFMVGAGLVMLTVASASLLYAWKSRAPQLMGWM